MLALQNDLVMKRLILISTMIPSVALSQTINFGLAALPNLQARSMSFANSFSTFYPQAGVSIPAGGGSSQGSLPLFISPTPVPSVPTGNLPIAPVNNAPRPNVGLPNPILPPSNGGPIQGAPQLGGLPGQMPIGGLPGQMPIGGGLPGQMPIGGLPGTQLGQMPGQPPIIAGPLTGGMQFPSMPNMYPRPMQPSPYQYYPRAERRSGFGNFAQILGAMASAFMGGGGGFGGGFGGGGFGGGGFGSMGGGGAALPNFYTPRSSAPAPVAQGSTRVGPDAYAEDVAQSDSQDYAEPQAQATAADDAGDSSEEATREAPAPASNKVKVTDDAYAESCDDCDSGPRNNPGAPDKIPTEQAVSEPTGANDSSTEASAATPGLIAPDAKAKNESSEACALKNASEKNFCLEFNKFVRESGAQDLKLSKGITALAKKHAEDVVAMIKAGKNIDFTSQKSVNEDGSTNKVSPNLGSDGSTRNSRLFKQLGITEGGNSVQMTMQYAGDAQKTRAEFLKNLTNASNNKVILAQKYMGLASVTYKDKTGKNMTVWTVVITPQAPKNEK